MAQQHANATMRGCSRVDNSQRGDERRGGVARQAAGDANGQLRRARKRSDTRRNLIELAAFRQAVMTGGQVGLLERLGSGRGRPSLGEGEQSRPRFSTWIDLEAM